VTIEDDNSREAYKKPSQDAFVKDFSISFKSKKGGPNTLLMLPSEINPNTEMMENEEREMEVDEIEIEMEREEPEAHEEQVQPAASRFSSSIL
jgi:hypothetical protein